MTEEDKKTKNQTVNTAGDKASKNTSAEVGKNASGLKYSAKISTISQNQGDKEATGSIFAEKLAPQPMPGLTQEAAKAMMASVLAKMSPEEMKGFLQQVMVQSGRMPAGAMQQGQIPAGSAQQQAPKPQLTKMQRLMKVFDVLVYGMDKSIKYIANVDDNATKTEVLKYTRPPAIFGLWVSIVTIFVFFIWGGFAPINQAALAQGSIVLESQKRIIQHPEGGVIDKILVNEGEYVTKGQDLVILSRVMSQAGREDAFNKHMMALAENARFIAQRDGLSQIKFEEELLKNAGNPEISKIIVSQKEIFKSLSQLREDEIKVSMSKITQYHQQIKVDQSALEAVSKQLSNKQQDYDSLKKLNDNQKIVSNAHLREIDSAVSQLDARKAEIIGHLAQSEEGLLSEEIRIKSIKNKFLHETVEGLKQNMKELVSARENYNQAQDRFQRTEIKAPVSGLVSNLLRQHFTDGGVLQANVPIMEIVPMDDHLVVDARVDVQDIDVVRKGQVAYSMITAFKTRVVPKIPGKVISVSPDMIPPKMQGERPYYAARIELDQEQLHKIMTKKHVELYPGMQVQVFIEIGPRTLLRYMLDPFLMSMDLAFRES